MKLPACLLGCVLYAPLASAQMVSISAASAEPGKMAEAEIVFKANPNQMRPTTLEWYVAYPAQDLIVDAEGPKIAAAARAAGKFLTCRGAWKKAPSSYAFHCILGGGVDGVQDGAVATIQFAVKPGAKSGNRTIELERVVAVNAQAKKIKVDTGNGVFTISGK